MTHDLVPLSRVDVAPVERSGATALAFAGPLLGELTLGALATAVGALVALTAARRPLHTEAGGPPRVMALSLARR